MNINPDIEAHDLLQQLAFHYARQCDSLLEVGSGSGELLRKLADKFHCQAWGIDPFAYDRSDGNVHFHALPAEKIDQLGRRFDFIFSVHSLHHFDSPQKFLQALEKTMSWNGVFVVVDWKYGTDTGISERYYKPGEVRDWLNRFDFQIKDQGATNENMFFIAKLKARKIAIPTGDGKTVFPKMLGQAPYFDIYLKEKDFRFLERRKNIYQNTLQHLKTLDVYDEIDDCQAILASRIGRKGRVRLEERGVKLFSGAGEIFQLLQKLDD